MRLINQLQLVVLPNYRKLSHLACSMSFSLAYAAYDNTQDALNIQHIKVGVEER